MTVKKRVSRIVGLTADIVKSAETASSERGPALTTTADEIARLWSREYGHALRACLSRAEVREIVSVAKRKAWPHLNDDAVRLGSMREFAERASALGADFRIAKMPWPSGLAVLGFYLGSDSGLEKPPADLPQRRASSGRRCDRVSTRSRASRYRQALFHPQRIGPAFPPDRIRGASRRSARARRRRAREPRSLSAQHGREIVRGCIAIEESREPATSNRPTAVKAVLGTARRYGLDLESLPDQKRLQYQAGLVHFTSLRQALLDEYGL